MNSTIRWCAVAAMGILVVCLLVSLPGQAPGASKSANSENWAQWRGAKRDGISAATGWSSKWSESPKVLWKKSVGWGYSSVAVRDGRVYTMGNSKVSGRDTDTVYCFDAKTGREIWKYSYPCKLGKYKGPRATPAVDAENVYTLSREGHLLCLDAKTGRLRWSKDITRDFGAKPSRWGFAGSPLLLGNALIIDVGPTIALDRKTGRQIWKSRSFKAGYSSPVAFELGSRQLIASFPEHGLIVLDAKSGRGLADYPWKTSYGINAATPIVSGDKLFISSGYGTGGALLSLSSGKLTRVWQNKNMRNQFSSCVLWKGYLYGFDGSTLKCISMSDGSVKWSKRGLGKGSLMLADGKLIVLSEKGELLIAPADPSGFKPTAQANVLSGQCWTVPVLADGRIYVRNQSGDLVCLSVKAEK